jgi:hypothetical protein
VMLSCTVVIVVIAITVACRLRDHHFIVTIAILSKFTHHYPYSNFSIHIMASLR